jgi:hypothetical protein
MAGFIACPHASAGSPDGLAGRIGIKQALLINV